MTYNPNFSWKRKTVTITTVTALTAGHQIKLTIQKETEMQANFRDLRFETTDGYGLPYWIETIVSNTATVWVKLKNTVNASTAIDIYMYYGNPYVSSTSNGNNTFEFFDDFTGSTINTNKWNELGSGTKTFNNGIFTYSGNTGTTNDDTGGSRLKSNTTFDIGTAIEARYYQDHTGQNAGTISYNRYPLAQSAAITDCSSNDNTVCFITKDATTTSGGSAGSWTTDWGRASIKRLSSSVSFSLIADDGSPSYSLTNTTNLPSGSLPIYTGGIVHTDNLSFSMMFDWILVRKYVATEPSTPAIGITVTQVNWNPQRKPITINTTTATPINYQVKLTIPFAPEMNIDFSDLRFVSKTNVPLDYWIESFTPGVTADVWVELADAINTSSSDYIYTHYGNPNLTNISSVTNTFIRVIGSDTDQPVKGAWTLDGNVLDTSGNSNNGTLYGGMGYTTGKFGQACLFDGINDYIHSSNTPSIDGGTQATYEAWVYPLSEPSDGSYSTILVAGDDTLPNWYPAQGRLLYFNVAGATTSKFYFDCGTDNANTYRFRYTINSYAPNQWYHIVVVFNSGTINFYINGVSDDGTAAGSGTSINTNANNTFSIGSLVRTGQSYAAAFFNGKIDEVRMYNRVLTQSEITDLYNNYGYLTPNYPGRELIRKYIATEPSFSIGTAESMNLFSYRKTLTINNNSGSSLIDYQIPITVAYNAHMQSNFNDIRFIDPTGNLLPYWIESKTDNITAYVWIKVNLPNYGSSPTGDNIVYMYYGNSNLTSASDGPNTFIVFDHFEGTSLDTNKWGISGAASYSVANSVLTVNGDYTTSDVSGVTSISTFNRSSTAIVTRYRFPLASSNNKFGVSTNGSGLTLRVSSYIFYHDQDARYFSKYTDAGAATHVTNMVKTTNYATYEMSNDGTNIRWTVDGTLQATSASASYWNSNAYIRYTGYKTASGWGGPMEIDYVYVKKFVLTNPTYTISIEEQSTGTLDISSTPSGAEIFIDTVDQSVTTPRVITGLTPGSHNYELTLSGYVSHTDTFSITSGSTTTISVTMVTPAHITATSLVITPSNPCISGSCIVTVDVIWTNTGGTSGTFTPKINVGTNPVVVYSAPNPVTVNPSGGTAFQQFTITGLTTGTHTICPDPN